MLTLSKPISAGQAQAYHRSEFANAKENYYTEGERVRGVWQGQLAERWGLKGEVNEEQFARLSEGRPVLPGLIDVDALRSRAYDGKKSGPEGAVVGVKSGPSRVGVGGVSGAVKTAPPPIAMRLGDDAEFDIEENTYTGARPNGHYVLTMAGVK